MKTKLGKHLFQNTVFKNTKNLDHDLFLKLKFRINNFKIFLYKIFPLFAESSEFTPFQLKAIKKVTSLSAA